MKVALKHNSFGFTIVELLVVIVVIGILAAITIVSYTGISQKAVASALQSDLSNTSKQLKLFQITNSNYPDSISTSCSTSTTTILCTKASPNTTYQYIVNNTANPQVFNLTATNTINNTSYTVTSSTQPTLGSYQTSGIVTDGLVLNLDTGNTNSYPAPFNGTAWTDLSSNNNHGTLMNDAGYSSSSGGVLTFDGVNDYVIIADATSLKPTNQISYSFWVKPTTFSGWNCVFGKYNSPRAQFGGGKLYIDDFPSANKPAGGQIVSNTTFLTNNWYYVSYIYDGSSLSLYVNGALDKSLATFNGVFSWNNNNYTIGTPAYLPYGFVNFFNGQLPNFQIYNRALTPTEITQNFNATKGRYGL